MKKSVYQTFFIHNFVPNGTKFASCEKGMEISVKRAYIRLFFWRNLCYYLKGSTTEVLNATYNSKDYYYLTLKKTYYVRVRAYTTFNGSNKYSKWSKVKSVKIK